MSGYDNFKARTFIDGMSSRESKINDARHIMKLEFDTDPAYCNSMFLGFPERNHTKGIKLVSDSLTENIVLPMDIRPSLICL